MNVADIAFDHPSFVVLAISLAVSICNEFISWVVVYRTDRYKYLKGQLLSGEKRLEVIFFTCSMCSRYCDG
jgi:hypothetical protein